MDSDQPDETLEQQFGLQLEQLILQGKDELKLIPMMAGAAARLCFAGRQVRTQRL